LGRRFDFDRVVLKYVIAGVALAWFAYAYLGRLPQYGWLFR
jgi:hypothetical protein